MIAKKKNYRLYLKHKRKLRIRKKVSGSDERPRLSVFKSAKHVYLQVIDDVSGHTLVSASSFEKGTTKIRATKELCLELGKKVAKKCLEKNITKIVFDKNGNRYHGRVQAVADGAREGGLVF